MGQTQDRILELDDLFAGFPCFLELEQFVLGVMTEIKLLNTNKAHNAGKDWPSG